MKNILFFAFSMIFSFVFSQHKLEGIYQNDFGETLKLNPDHTFEYKWNFDLASSWNIGTWKSTDNQNIYLTINEIMDTVKEDGKSVLSEDKISNTITQMDYVLQSITSGGQSRNPPLKKFLIKGKILYPYFKDGKLRDQKEPSPINGTLKGKPWFERVAR
ncbi:hypothetical protein ASG21_15100 [Chryseobacterium sp. Leaf394]|nr:hypothetical protein ASG21_15100 [Chryseobacterium sp. Leaf394]